MSRLNSRNTTLAAFGLMLCAGVGHATPATPLITNPASPAIAVNYTLGGSAGSPQTVGLTVSLATGSAFWEVDPNTVPAWLSLSPMSGTATTVASGGNTLTFNMSSFAGSMGAGVYTTTVHVLVFGDQDLTIGVTGTITPATSAISVNGGATQFNNLNWSIGAAIPSITFSVASSNLPVSFTAGISSTPTSTGGTTNWASINHGTAVAYTWGTPLTVTFNPVAFLEAASGDVLTATVTLTPAAGSPVTVAIQYTVQPPTAVISGVIPAAVPVTTSGSVTVILSGTGFIAAPSNQKTVLQLNGATGDSGTTYTVINSNTISLTIPAASSSQYMANSGSPVAITVWNPATASAATGSVNLAVTSNPIINSITSVATYLEPAAGAPQASAPAFAPYDVVAIFGNNLCPDCGGSNPAQIVGAPDSTYYRYATKLSPDSNGHWVTVDFQQTASGNAAVGSGYLLFASNNQINVLVPAAVAATGNLGTGLVQVIVNYFTAGTPSPTSVSSTPYVINTAASDPGILTLNADGQGQGAILLPDGSVNGSGNKANHSPAQIVSVFLAGLGVPNSTANNTTTTTALTYPTSCISALGTTGSGAITGYMTTINTTVSGYTPPSPLWTTLDGAVIHSGFIASPTLHFAPCITSGVTATINGVTAVVDYAGWVDDAIAGLYQVNLTIPSSPGTIPTGTNAGQVPIQIKINGVATQSGVTMYIQ